MKMRFVLVCGLILSVVTSKVSIRPTTGIKPVSYTHLTLPTTPYV